MVFETGDLVVGWGRLVVDADGVLLDFARSVPLSWPARDDRTLGASHLRRSGQSAVG
jgi:hypothetical protein